ncbi:MAG TPA: hypothetical protein VNV85_02420 [Puia sp.]|jgi:hypothetical protein|nr:hypothetical protein [Puia sp.]
MNEELNMELLEAIKHVNFMGEAISDKEVDLDYFYTKLKKYNSEEVRKTILSFDGIEISDGFHGKIKIPKKYFK